MSLTLLFDLDDTLLDTNLEAFIPAYFQTLSDHVSSLVTPDRLVPALISGMKLMMESGDPSRTLQYVFEKDFYEKIGIPKQELIEILDDFYDNIFPAIESKTSRRPEAAALIDWALSKGYRLALATDPLFLRKVTHHRIRWAGLDPSQFEVVSTFEDFHFSKSHPAYYAEVLSHLGWPDGPVLMVGNDVQRDLITANRLGLKTYFIDGDPASSPGFEAGRGRLAELRPWLESINLSMLEPSFKSPDGISGIMQATPAAIGSMLSSLTEDEWKCAPARGDWAMNEILCHLRDTEREIHQMQLKLMLERDGVFIPRPDTSVWASERDYAHENGEVALQEFVSARIETSEMMMGMDESVWERKARHAIFGPTDFLEVTSFMADHDRMHLQQIKKTLWSLRNGRV